MDELHPNISVQVLQTILSKFPVVLRRRIRLAIKTFFSL